MTEPARRILLADGDAFYVAVARMVDPEGSLGIDHAGNSDVERITIGEQNAASWLGHALKSGVNSTENARARHPAPPAPLAAATNETVRPDRLLIAVLIFKGYSHCTV